MLSDLVGIDDMLEEISFDGKMGEPLRPFEQLMACMPPSQAHTLPEPYRWLLTSPTSPIKDYYPTSFTVDMNGKRWPWEAVVLIYMIVSGVGNGHFVPGEAFACRAGLPTFRFSNI